jgi:isopenicillin N synthase-like dioxygenase
VDSSEDEYYTAEAAAYFFPDNVWPEAPEDFRSLSEAYYRRMTELSATLCEIFAIALGLPRAYFAPMIDKPFSFLRYVYYPALSQSPGAGQLRAGAHSDYGSFTFVNFNDAPGGLQVHGGDGEWIDVPVVPDSFVVNLGDLMERWTNDQWRSTLHRVVVPDEDQFAASERLSLVFFHEPNYDTMIEALPTCVPPGEAPRYEPISCGEHLARKVMAQQDLGESFQER